MDLRKAHAVPGLPRQINMDADGLCHVHGQVQNLFRVGRNHLKAVHHRLLRDRAFADWREVTCAH